MRAETLGGLLLAHLREHPGATDGELAKKFERSHQTINKTCRRLEERGLLSRQSNPDRAGLIGNYASDAAPGGTPARKVRAVKMDSFLQEEDIKRILTDWLKKDGWAVRIAWGRSRGVDIDARRDGKRWLLEVKGPGASSNARSNYFIGVLGETLKRMDDPDARYTIVFPDMAQYRTSWAGLPKLAKERTGIDMLLVDEKGNIQEFQ